MGQATAQGTTFPTFLDVFMGSFTSPTRFGWVYVLFYVRPYTVFFCVCGGVGDNANGLTSLPNDARII